MDRQDNSSNGTDLALTGASIASKLFGIAIPPAATVGIVTDCIRERRAKKFGKRLESLILSLERRVKQLEDQTQELPNVDLFDEIVAKAISDEDEDKTEFYAALIEYCITNKPNPYEIRLLCNALKDLTVYEMNAFYEFIINQNTPSEMPQQLKEIYWNRVEYLGLFKGGSVKHPSNVTLLGQKFIDIYNLAMQAS